MYEVNIKETYRLGESLGDWEWGWESWPDFKGPYVDGLLGVEELSADLFESEFFLKDFHEAANDSHSCLVLDGQGRVVLNSKSDTCWREEGHGFRDHLQSVEGVVEIEKVLAEAFSDFFSVFFVSKKGVFY